MELRTTGGQDGEPTNSGNYQGGLHIQLTEEISLFNAKSHYHTLGLAIKKMEQESIKDQKAT